MCLLSPGRPEQGQVTLIDDRVEIVIPGQKMDGSAREPACVRRPGVTNLADAPIDRRPARRMGRTDLPPWQRPRGRHTGSSRQASSFMQVPSLLGPTRSGSSRGQG
jgi:hypothetical protein